MTPVPGAARAVRSGPGGALALAPAMLALTLASGGCATLAGGGGGDENLPNAGAGPFRALRTGEIGHSRVAPYAMEEDDTFSRDASVIDADGDPATLEVLAFFAATLPSGDGAEQPAPDDPPNAIVRHHALDGRSIDRAPVTVLVPEAAWEGGTVGAPSALLVGGDVWLYCAAAGGIGLARSAGGDAFVREPGPVLAPDPASWEGGAVPRSPGVVRLSDGSYRMFYEVAGDDGASRIGEARSDDGVAWARVGTRPVLAPFPSPAGGASDDAYDDASVGSPAPLVAESSLGRPIVRVYYAARSRAGAETVGLAARYGDEGPLDRAASPVFGAGSDASLREPCAVPFGDFTLLFATEREPGASPLPTVAVGVAPATVALPPPEPR